MIATIVALTLALAFAVQVIAAPLHDAAEHGDITAIAELLQAGADPNMKTERRDDTPLHWAAHMGHTEAVAVLLEAGANANLKNARGYTPLEVAKLRNHAEIAETLLAHMLSKPNPDFLLSATKDNDFDTVSALLSIGTDPDVKNSDGQTPLQLALNSSHAKVARALLDAGANPNAKNKKGESMLHAAVGNKNTILFLALLDAGADLNVKTRQGGDTPLHWVAYLGLTKMARPLLIVGADPNVKNKRGETPLALAKRRSKTETAKLLLAYMLEKPNPELLLSAAHETDLETVTALLAAGTDPNVKDESGAAPLHMLRWGDENRSLAIARALLDAGADPNAKTNDGSTSLHTLARRGYATVVAALLEAGADANAKDGSARTPLHYAAEENHTKVVADLLEAGADPNAEDEDRLTPVIIAKSNDDADVIALLRRDGPLHESVRKQHFETFVALLGEGADLNSRNAHGETPLHVAAGEESRFGPIALFALLEAGANPNVQDKSGATPLHNASRGEQPHSLVVVLALLDAGADPNVQDTAGLTPLHGTLDCRGNANAPAVIATLLEAGADPQVRIRILPGMELPPWYWVAMHLDDIECPIDVVSLLRGAE